MAQNDQLTQDNIKLAAQQSEKAVVTGRFKEDQAKEILAVK